MTILVSKTPASPRSVQGPQQMSGPRKEGATADPEEVAVSAWGVAALPATSQITQRRPMSHSKRQSTPWSQGISFTGRRGICMMACGRKRHFLNFLQWWEGGGGSRPGSLPVDLESWECAGPALGGFPVLLDVSFRVFEGPNVVLDVLLQVH